MRVVIWLVFVSACAIASTPREQPIDAQTQRDGTVQQFDGSRQDGGPPPDAFVPHDGPPVMVDGGNPLVCTDNTNCVVAGTCCFIALCVSGTAVGANLCFPN